MARETGTPGILREVRSDDAPAFLIQRTARLLRVLFHRLVQAHQPDLTPEMWLVLSRLVARDGQSQNELAAATFRDRPNTSRIVSGLERRGYVRREPDLADRRRVSIRLTPRGRELVAATTPLAARTRDRLHEGLEAAELATLRRALRRIEINTLAALAEVDALLGGEADDEPPADLMG